MSKFDTTLKLLQEGPESIESFIETIKPKLIKAAQKVYDEWEQDDEGYSEEYGSGGICDVIADEMGYAFDTAVDGTPFESWDAFSLYDEHECHTDLHIVNHDEKEIIRIGLSPYEYEEGGGYTWRKLPNVQLNPDAINPSSLYLDYENFFNEEEEMHDY